MPIRKNLVQQRKQIAKRNNVMTQKRRLYTNSHCRLEQVTHKSEHCISK